jgi:hypothetical protein
MDNTKPAMPVPPIEPWLIFGAGRMVVRPHRRPSRTRSSCVHRYAAGRDYAALLQLESIEFD